MFRKALLLAFVISSCLVSAQDYVQDWAAVSFSLGASPDLTLQQVATVPTNGDVLVGGLVGNQAPFNLQFGKYSSAGAPLWETLDSRSYNALGNIVADNAGHLYYSGDAGNTVIITSLDSATGQQRWTQSFTKVSTANSVVTRLAVRNAGTSTFLYAIVSENGLNARVFRLNSATGQTISGTVLPGSGLDRDLIIDGNGNLTAIFQDSGSAYVQKMNQGLNTVFKRTLAQPLAHALAVNAATGQIGALSQASGAFASCTLELLNPTSGQVLHRQTSLFVSVDETDKFQIYPRPDGSWVYQATGQFINLARFFSMSNELQITHDLSLDMEIGVVDASGQIHGRGSVSGVTSFPRDNSFTPSPTTQLQSIAIDASSNVCVVGFRLDNGVRRGVTFRLNQKFLAGTDVFSEPFTTRLDVTAPGVLANDTLSLGGVLTVVTTTTKGTLTLAQDGSFSYVPGASFNGSDQFSYRVTVGGTSRTATCFIKRLTFASITFSPTTVVGGDTRSDLVVTFSTATSSLFREFRVDSNRPEIATLINPILPITPGAASTSRRLITALVQADQPVVFTTSALSGQTKTGTVIIRTGSLDSVAAIDASPVYEGLVTRFRVKLQSPASGQAPISLFYRETSTVTGPTSVTPIPGSLFVDFTIRANAGTAGQTVKVFAFREERSKATGDLPILAAPKVQSVAVLDGPVYAGVTHRLELTLDKVAGNTTMRFFNETRPDSVGFLVPDFAITSATKATSAFHPPLISANKTATVTTFASSPTEPEAKTTTFLVRPNLLDTFTISPITISAFGTTQGRVTFNWVATGTGIKVKVSTTTPALVAVPNEVTMLPGRTVLTFPIAGRGKTGNAKVTVSVGDKAITRGITITQ